MKSLLALLALMLMYTPALQAQKENNIWCFGYGGSLNFNGPAPVQGTSRSNSGEGAASVCDRAGNLLFYIGRDTVWNRNHQYMPNGTGMLGNYYGSSHRGVGIVQSPADTTKYYLFLTDALELISSHNVYYSLIDMNLDGGLGDVTPGQKNMLLDTNTNESITLMPMAGCNGHWIVLHQQGNTEYRAFPITTSGLGTTPVISHGLLTLPSFTISWTMSNNAGNGFATSISPFTELGSFDNSSGVLSNFRLIDTFLYYPTFSPDDSRLYAASNQGLYQLDLSLMPNTAAVLSSLTVLDTGIYRGSRLGPDQMLYIIRFNFSLPMPTSSLTRIQNPNALGTAAIVERNYIPLMNGVGLELGSPAAVQRPIDTAYRRKDTVICQAASVTLSADPDEQQLLWSTGSTAQQETFSQSGTYWLRGRKQCRVFIDSFHLTFRNLQQPLLGPDTSLCPGDTLSIALSIPGADYRWQDGSTAASYVIRRPGTYSVQVGVTPCQYNDTIKVSLLEPSLYIGQHDTTICSGTALQLQVTAVPESSLLWSNGATGSSISVKEAGTYVVTATNACGTLSDSVTIEMEICNCKPFVPNVFSPNGDGKNDRLKVFLNCPGIREYQFAIYNRYGQRVFFSNTPNLEWDGRTNQHDADMGTYFYYLQYKNPDGNSMKKKGDITLLR